MIGQPNQAMERMAADGRHLRSTPVELDYAQVEKL